MAEQVYECMFILNPNAYAKNPSGLANVVDDLVKNSGGSILASRLWNEQKLAYPINGHRKGVYWLTYFSIESASLPKFTRACKLQDMVLRQLAVKVDHRLVDTLVSVAKGEKIMPQTELATVSVVADDVGIDEIEEDAGEE